MSSGPVDDSFYRSAETPESMAAAAQHAPRRPPRPARTQGQRIEDRLYPVARGRGVWPAPEPLSRCFPVPRGSWVPVADAAPSRLALVWTERSPGALMAALAAQARAVTGWADGGDPGGGAARTERPVAPPA